MVVWLTQRLGRRNERNPRKARVVKRAQPSSDAHMRRNSSRGSASPSTYRGGSGRRRKRRSNRLAKCAAFIVGAYALVASLFYYRATHHHQEGPQLRGTKKPPPPRRARVALALPFVGPRLPPFVKAFARSCGNAIGAVDVLLLLSDPDAVPVEARNSRPPWLPDLSLIHI